MDKNKKNLKFSLFVKIIVFNIVIILVLTLVSQGVFYNVIEKAWRNNFIKYNLSSIHISFNNIEREIMDKTISIPYNYFSNIFANKDILYPVNKDISSSPENIVKLVESMDLISKNSPNVMSMDVYYPKTNTVVTGFRTVHFLHNETEIERYIPWYSGFANNKKNIKLLPANNSNYPRLSPTITYVAKVPQFDANSNDPVVAVHIDLNSFFEYIDQDIGNFMIVDNDNQLIYESTGELKKNFYPYIKDILPNIEASRNVQSIDLRTNLGSMVAVVQKSNILDIKYIYLVPYKIFYKDYTNMTNLFLLVSFIFIVINIVVIILLSRRNNNTYVERISELSQKAGINVDKHKKSIDDSIEQLVCKIRVLNSEIENAKPMLYQNEIRALIFDKSNSVEGIPLQIRDNLSSVYSVIINLVNDNHKNNIGVSNYLNKKVKEVTCGYDVFFSSIEKNEIIGIICHEDGMQQNSLLWVCDFLNESLCEYKITLGKPFELTRYGIKESFDNTMLVYKYRFIFQEQKQLCYIDINFDNMKNTGSHLKVLTQVERGIVGNSYIEVEEKIQGLVSAFKTGVYSIDYCMSTLRDLIAMLNRLIIASGLDMWIIFGYDIRNYFKKIENIDVFEEWVLSMCKVIIENKEVKKKANSEFEPELIKLVKENIENDISLDFLADSLNIRSDTLSRMFKSVVGKNYSEYIKDEKMSCAVELLLSDKYSVKEIAEKLGYNSIQYFIKTFKSTYGETPYQYKKIKLKK